MLSTSVSGHAGNAPIDSEVRPRCFPQLSDSLGVELWVQQDYLLPFPLAGNKWVKLVGEHGKGKPGHAYLTNGGVNSNHCRTLALWAAFHGHRCHLILHDDKGTADRGALDFIQNLGASYSVVPSAGIADALAQSAEQLQDAGFETVTIPGGGHSPRAIRAYADYASSVLKWMNTDFIFHASGTGGTQAGLSIARHSTGSSAELIGISVARSSMRGQEVISEAIQETLGISLDVDFRDEFTDGGYGPGGQKTAHAVAKAGAGGLVLDSTYTGKAFAGLLASIQSGEVERGSKVLFWHTGGLYLAANTTNDMFR